MSRVLASVILLGSVVFSPLVLAEESEEMCPTPKELGIKDTPHEQWYLIATIGCLKRGYKCLTSLEPHLQEDGSYHYVAGCDEPKENLPEEK